MLDEIQTESVANNNQRHFLAVFFLSFFWGFFGVDRFYLGKIWTGILKLLTFGGFGVWVLIDLTMIMSGSMRDKNGNEMLQFARYKKFAATTALVFGIIICLIIFVSGISIFYLVTQFIQGGGIDKFINNSLNQTIDLNQLNGLNINL